jgi:hypothetical protein
MAGKTRRVKHRRGGGLFEDERLRIYANSGNLEGVRYYLDKGANIEGKASEINFGVTALITASKGGHINVVKELLDRGANIEATDMYGRTSLVEASNRGHTDVVRELLKRGASTARILPGSRGDMVIKAVRTGQRQAVAVTGAHPESTMPNPDVASMVGKFLGGKRKTRKQKRKTGKRKTRK